MHDTTISVEGNKFLFIGFWPRGGWEHSSLEPCCPKRPSTSPAPHRSISQNQPRSPAYPYLFLSQLCKQVSIHSGKCSCSFRVAILQQVSPAESGVHCPQPPCFGKTCITLNGIMVEPREAHVPRDGLLHASFTEAEVCGSASPVPLQASPMNPCLVRQVPAQFHQLLCGILFLTPDSYS